MGYWNPNVLRVATPSVVPNEEQQENPNDNEISKMLEESCSISDNAWQPPDSNMVQQNNPKSIVPSVDEEDDISKLLEDSSSNTDNTWQPQDTTTQQNNPQPIVPYVDEEDDISKLLEDSSSNRGNSCPP